MNKEQIRRYVDKEHGRIAGPQEAAQFLGFARRFGAAIALINDYGIKSDIPEALIKSALIDYWRHGRLRRWRWDDAIPVNGWENVDSRHSIILAYAAGLDAIFGTTWAEQMNESLNAR